MQHHRIDPDISVLSDHAEIPGLGYLPVNTFVLHAEQPLVVDTGLSTPDKDYLRDLATAIDPADVRWVWLTHPDRDHLGGLWDLLEVAPQAKLVTTFLGVGILSCEYDVPLHRVHLLNPGQSLDLGDRTVTAFRPPLFDSPATTGFHDDRTGALFSSDCFGGPMSSVDLAESGDARDTLAEIDDAMALWASVDAPWARVADPVRFAATVDPIRRLRPSRILSTHLPPATDLNDRLFDNVLRTPGSPEFVGPDQAALEALLATFELAAV